MKENPDGSFCTRCEGCLLNDRKADAILRARRRELGLCSCGAELDGAGQCAKCCARTTARNAKKLPNTTYWRRREEGFCVHGCGQFADEGYVSCADCREALATARRNDPRRWR